MTDNWQHISGPAEAVKDRVAEMKSPAIPDNVVPLFPQRLERPDLSALSNPDACWLLLEKLCGQCSRAEADIGIGNVRAVLAAVLADIDEQIEKDGGGEA